MSDNQTQTLPQLILLKRLLHPHSTFLLSLSPVALRVGLQLKRAVVLMITNAPVNLAIMVALVSTLTMVKDFCASVKTATRVIYVIYLYKRREFLWQVAPTGLLHSFSSTSLVRPSAHSKFQNCSSNFKAFLPSNIMFKFRFSFV